jgi:hypothetical protein
MEIAAAVTPRAPDPKFRNRSFLFFRLVPGRQRWRSEELMNDHSVERSLATLSFDISQEPVPSDPGANPFRLVVDPAMRIRLRRALFDLIESHDQELARYVADGSLALDSYKEYIEIFARSLRDTVASREGVLFLLEACGFKVEKEAINLNPETRWRVTRDGTPTGGRS